jgi:hypothetical protein
MVGLLLRRVNRLAKEDDEFLGRIDGFGAFKTALGGSPLSAAQVLALDDDQLWAFIARLRVDVSDATTNELAGRIVERDLFRPVPLTTRELARLFDEAPGGSYWAHR